MRHPKDRKEISELLKDEWLNTYVDFNSTTEIITMKEHSDPIVKKNY